MSSEPKGAERAAILLRALEEILAATAGIGGHLQALRTRLEAPSAGTAGTGAGPAA